MSGEAPMTPEAAEAAMLELARKTRGDPEAFHHNADMLMVRILHQLGYGAMTSIFIKSKRWYS